MSLEEFKEMNTMKRQFNQVKELGKQVKIRLTHSELLYNLIEGDYINIEKIKGELLESYFKAKIYVKTEQHKKNLVDPNIFM